MADRAGFGDARRRHGACSAGERNLRRVGAEGSRGFWDEPGLRRLHRCSARRRRRGNDRGVFRRAQKSAGLERGDRAGKRVPNRIVCRPRARASELRYRTNADGLAVLARCGGDGLCRHTCRRLCNKQRALGLVHWCPAVICLRGLCRHALHVASASAVTCSRTPAEHAPADANLVYFAFVNHTTPGYGDVVPVERWRLLGPMMAMNGVLLFGWSTAVIFEMLRKHWSVSKFPNRRPRSWHPCMQREDPKPTDALGVTRNAVSLHRISCPPIDALHSIGDDLATAARRSKSR